jgi:hypothetical protein
LRKARTHRKALSLSGFISLLLPPPASLFEELRIARNIFGPELPHHPLHVLGSKAAPVRILVAQLTKALNPRKGIAGTWSKRYIGRLMYNALRRNIELIAPD